MKGKRRSKEEEVERKATYSGCPLDFHRSVGAHTQVPLVMERGDV